jgi:hypothetical protein
MKSVAAESLILASSDIVWDIITDAGNYPVWGSGITDIKGEIRDRSWIRVRIRNRGRKPLRLRIRQYPGHRMTWTRRLPLGLLTLERSFTLADYTGMAHLEVRDTASGPLRWLVPRRVRGTDPSVSVFVDEVKFRAELFSFHLHGGVFPAAFQPAHPPSGTTRTGRC